MTAVITMCLEAGAKEVVVLDNPTTDPRSAFETTGLAQAISDADGKLVYLQQPGLPGLRHPRGQGHSPRGPSSPRRSRPTLHRPGPAQAALGVGRHHDHEEPHGRHGRQAGDHPHDFAQKIVDVNTLVKPTLAILDGYRVLFRNGPTGGSLDDVRLAKTLVAGTNPVSIDAYGTQFFDKTPADYKWLVEATTRGMGEIDLSKLTVATGEPRSWTGRAHAGPRAASGRAPLGPPLPLGLPARLPAALPRAAHHHRLAGRHRFFSGFLLADPLIAVNSAAHGFFRWEMLLAVPVILSPLFLGRVFCGYVCPMGFLIELFGPQPDRHPGPRARERPAQGAALRPGGRGDVYPLRERLVPGGRSPLPLHPERHHATLSRRSTGR